MSFKVIAITIAVEFGLLYVYWVMNILKDVTYKDKGRTRR